VISGRHKFYRITLCEAPFSNSSPKMLTSQRGLSIKEGGNQDPIMKTQKRVGKLTSSIWDVVPSLHCSNTLNLGNILRRELDFFEVLRNALGVDRLGNDHVTTDLSPGDSEREKSMVQFADLVKG